MARIVRCPNCNAPLDKAPTGAEEKCPYCSATLMATQYVPSPMPLPAYPLPPPQTPAFPVPLPPPPTRHRSWLATVIVLNLVFGILGGVAFAVWRIIDKVQESVWRVTTTTTTTGGSPMNAPGPTVKVDGGKLVLGRTTEVELASASGGKAVIDLGLECPAAGTMEVSAADPQGPGGCGLRALDPRGRELTKVEPGGRGLLFASFPAGPCRVEATCRGYGGPRKILVLARLVPTPPFDQRSEIVIPTGMTATGAFLDVAQAGPYFVAAAGTQNRSIKIIVFGPDGNSVETADNANARGVARLEADLEPGRYTLLVVQAWREDADVDVGVAWSPAAPVPLANGQEMPGTLTRFVAERRYVLTLEAPAKLEARLSSDAFGHAVELRDAVGARIGEPADADRGRAAVLRTEEPLPAGSYVIAVAARWTEERPEGVYLLVVSW
jgi:hypothetical protein